MRSAVASFLLITLTATAAAEETGGIIQLVDTQRGQIQVEVGILRSRRKTVTFDLSKDIEVQVAGRASLVGDLLPGQRVRVVYESVNGRYVAKQIRRLDIVPLAMSVLPKLLGEGQLLPGTTAAPAPVQTVDPKPAATLGSSGVLRRISLTEREIVVVQPGQETSYLVPDDTRISRDGRPITFEELREGEIATVQAESDGKRRLATTITIGSGTSAATPPPPPRPLQPRRP